MSFSAQTVPNYRRHGQLTMTLRKFVHSCYHYWQFRKRQVVPASCFQLSCIDVGFRFLCLLEGTVFVDSFPHLFLWFLLVTAGGTDQS